MANLDADLEAASAVPPAEPPPVESYLEDLFRTRSTVAVSR